MRKLHRSPPSKMSRNDTTEVQETLKGFNNTTFRYNNDHKMIFTVLLSDNSISHFIVISNIKCIWLCLLRELAWGTPLGTLVEKKLTLDVGLCLNNKCLKHCIKDHFINHGV